MVMMLFCFVMTGASIALSVIFVMMIAWNTALQPLFNSLTFKLEESGYKINFGVTRAMGSLAFSALCAVLGTWAERYGTIVVPLAGEITLLLLLITLVLIKHHFNKACQLKAEIQKTDQEVNLSPDIPVQQEEINLIQFIKRNKIFLVVNLGVAGIFFSNAIFNSFMLQIVENVGGTSEDMGRILSVMAFLEIPPLFLFERVHRRVSNKRLLQLGAICFALKILCAALAGSVTMVYVAQLFQLTSFGIFLPAMVSFIDEIMDKGEAVKGQALYTIVTTVATIFASLAGGIMLDVKGASTMLVVSTLITGLGALLLCISIERVKTKIIRI